MIKESAKTRQLEDDVARLQREAQLLQAQLADLHDQVQTLNAKNADLDTRRNSAELRGLDLQHQLETALTAVSQLEKAFTQEKSERLAEQKEVRSIF